MEWTLQDELDVDVSSEIDSVVASRPELDFDIDDLPQLELDDDHFITEPNGWFDPQFIFQKYANQQKRIYKLDLSSDSESDLTMVDPFLVTPLPTPYDNDDDCQLKLPKIETHIKEEPSSEYEDNELYSHHDFDYAIPTNDVDVKFPFEAQKWPTEYKVDVKLEVLVKEELQEYDDDDVGYPKPPYSYACLIAMALKNSQSGTLPVSRIYSFICTHFPYFQTAPKGWKNSIRHNLSLNKCFDKIERPRYNKRGGLWTMKPEKAAKMDLEVQKWSRKDSSAIKKCMTSPDLLELLERGEVKFRDDSPVDEGSDEDAAVNSVAGSYDESNHEDEVEDHYIFEDHDYSRLNYTVRAQCVYQPVHRKTPMDVGAAEAFLEAE